MHTYLGTIPAQVSALTKLKFMYAKHNQFVDECWACASFSSGLVFQETIIQPEPEQNCPCTDLCTDCAGILVLPAQQFSSIWPPY